MRIAALCLPALLLVTGGCSLFSSESETQFAQPNSLMADEIDSRVKQIPFQHREELLQNLLWLSQTGETTIPSLLKSLKSENPKVRSSAAWVLGRIHDRRTVPMLQALANDSNETVRLEVCRTLVSLGDMQRSPSLIEGLDSNRKEVRYLCHEALKAATGRDFGFDHLSENETTRHQAVLGWRQWWAQYSGDNFFAQSYQQKYQLNPAATPMGETQNPSMGSQDPQPQNQGNQGNTNQGSQGYQSQPQNQTQPQGNEDPDVFVIPQGQGQEPQGQGNGQPQPNQEPMPPMPEHGQEPTPQDPPAGSGTGTTGTGTTGTGTTGTGTTGTGTTGTGTTGSGTGGTSGTSTTPGGTSGSTPTSGRPNGR